MKKILVFALLLVSLLLLAACGEKVDPNRPDFDIVKNGQSDYTVVVSSDAKKSVVSAAEDFIAAMKEKTGAELILAKDGEFAETGHEILFGNTNRSDSETLFAELEEGDYRFAASGEKLVFAADDKTIDTLVARFWETVDTTEGLTLSKELFEEYLVPVRTYVLGEVLDRVKVQGRHSVIDNAITADWSGNGILFNAHCKNDVILTMNLISLSPSQATGSYFTVYIDGVRQPDRLLATGGRTEMKIAEGLAEGDHSFAVYKQSHVTQAGVNLESITLEGRLTERPADSELYIEFLGDSITAGYGTYAADNSTDQMSYPYTDGSQSYGFFCAEDLGADYWLCGKCSWGLLAGSGGETVPSIYKYINHARSKDLYDFSTRKLDVAVINLGTNDSSQKLTGPKFLQAAIDFVNDIREKNGKDVPIVFVYGMMNDTGFSYLRKAARDLGGEEAGIYTIEMPLSRSGGGNHPSGEEQKICGDKLAEFIKETVLK